MVLLRSRVFFFSSFFFCDAVLSSRIEQIQSLGPSGLPLALTLPATARYQQQHRVHADLKSWGADHPVSLTAAELPSVLSVKPCSSLFRNGDSRFNCFMSIARVHRAVSSSKPLSTTNSIRIFPTSRDVSSPRASLSMPPYGPFPISIHRPDPVLTRDWWPLVQGPNK